MFTAIYKHELKYWFKKPSFYIFFIIMFAIGILIGASSAGFFDNVSIGGVGKRIVNSPIRIYSYFGITATLFYLLIPSIIGVTIHRDFKSEMHSVLYSYPFTKSDYLFAKFISGFTVILIISLGIGLGLFIGFRFPGTNPELVGAFHLSAYLKTFILGVIPNTLFIGIIVFSIVTFTRNTTSGFIAVICFFMLQGFLSSLTGNVDLRYISSLLNPNGSDAIKYYTQYWTPSERNTLPIPIGSLLILNRIIWISIGAVIFVITYKKFSFSQTASKFKLFKKKSEQKTKDNSIKIVKISLPKVKYKFDFFENLKKTWKLSNIDFKFVVKHLPFIAILFVSTLLLFMTIFETGIKMGRTSIPVTFKMLELGTSTFDLFILIITFLYSGVLINKSLNYNTNHLIDSTPTPNWVLLLSKFIALIKIQILLLTIIMLAGIIKQTISGHFNYEFDLYFYHLYVLELSEFLFWSFLAFLLHTLLKNTYLGLFLLFLISFFAPMLHRAGIEQGIFILNSGGIPRYTDLNGYGFNIVNFFKYKIYWNLLGGIFLILSLLFWVRGFISFKERLKLFKKRLNTLNISAIVFLLICFLSFGGYIYYEDNILNVYTSQIDREKQRVEFEKKYKKYQGRPQPRVVSVDVKFDIFPKTRDFKFKGKLKTVNRTKSVIDSLLILKPDYPSEIKFNKNVSLVSKDTIFNFYIYKLKKPLQIGDSIELNFTVKNKKNTLFKKHSPIFYNGTFVHNNEFVPSFGYNDSYELKDDQKRKKYGLKKNDLKPMPTDTTALGNTYISRDSDWINFKATVSTSKDQIAIAPGYLQREWIENNRHYFEYKMDSKILNFYAFNSGKYEVKHDQWKNVAIEIYYHKGHEQNLKHMINGIKASLEYNSKYFSPYQHKQVRIIEFPRVKGSFAQSFPNTIPFSEGAAFLSVNDNDNEEVNRTFAITTHELAHQWWAHQVIGADVRGATVMSESMSEYVALKVIEHKKGKSSMHEFLKESLDGYLRRRSYETKRELPLLYTDGQGYVRYEKGALVFYALADYLGEEKLNGALKNYLEKVKFQKPPYTTSLEMMDEIKKVVPDSLKYTLKDMFETITLYRNKIVKAKSTKLTNGKYKVDIEFNVSKYRNDEHGKIYYDEHKKDSLTFNQKGKKPITSVVLADYIDVGIFGKEKGKEIELYLRKHKIKSINNKISIIVDKKPFEVGIDPYNKLIDINSKDNRKKIEQ